MTLSKIAFIVSLLALQGLNSQAYAQDNKWSPEQAYYGSGGILAYTPDQKGNTIPDFSHVGYLYGDEAIPDVPVVIELNPVEGDDGATIQNAINQVSVMSPDKNGFRGAVLLKKGTYQIKGQILIRASGVVLRGEGQTEDGTVLIADGNVKRDFIVIGNGSGRKLDPFSYTKIVEEYVAVGRKYVVVENVSKYSEGDQIAIYRPGTAKWISDLKMDQIPDPDGETSQWKPDSYSFYFERVVTKIRGDTIFFRNPVVMAMETNYGGGSVYKSASDRISKVGVEDIFLQSVYKHETDEEHAWTAIQFNSIEHGWARRVTSRHFGYACVSVGENGRLITVEDCHSRDPISVITGGRRYSFNISGSLNLFKGCTTTEGRHDFVTGSRVCGPNVFTQCSASKVHADIGPHHRWAMGTLFDVIETDGAINVQDRGASGSGHGWAGANQVFWNCTGASSICQNPWVSANNYNFGFMGEKDPGWNERPDGVWVGHNKPGILPQSLYQAQLDSRSENIRVFSVYTSLDKVNDSSFVLSFNMPFLSFLAKPTNFSVAGDAGYEGSEFSVTTMSDTSIMLVMDGIGPLPAFSSVIVNVENMLSATGRALNGLSSATYTEPDLRPVVTGTYAKVNNEDDTLEASSTKPGEIFLLRFNEEYNYLDAYQTVSDLEQAVNNNFGRKVDAPVANTAVPIATRGLPGGYYIYFAVDEEGRISAPGDVWPEIEATGPILGAEDEQRISDVFAWSSNGIIFFQPTDNLTTFSARIYDLSGRIMASGENLVGEKQLEIPDYHGVLIVRMIGENGLNVKVKKLFYSSIK